LKARTHGNASKHAGERADALYPPANFWPYGGIAPKKKVQESFANSTQQQASEFDLPHSKYKATHLKLLSFGSLSISLFFPFLSFSSFLFISFSPLFFSLLSPFPFFLFFL
jgi:hypothetical protein